MENGIWLDRVIAALKSRDHGPDPETGPERGPSLGADLPSQDGPKDGPGVEAWTQNDARCYELVEEMGREGYSCLIYTGAGRKGSEPFGQVTYCQLRRNDGSILGTQVPGTGAAATRTAICRAYLALRLRTNHEEGRTVGSILPRDF